MLRKVVLGLSVALATATGSVAMAASAQAGPLDRVKNAVGVVIKADVRAARDLAHGDAKQAVGDVVFGAKTGALLLTGRGGGGFGNRN